jgi:hypothetical protein
VTIVFPVRVVKMPGGFKILDARGRSLAYVYAAEGARLAAMPDAVV